MASAIVPILAAAAPLLTPLIESLIQKVETIFPKAGSGATKMTAVVNAIQPVANQLSASGAIPGQLDAASITTMAETILQQLKTSGTLTPATGSTSQPAAKVQAQASGQTATFTGIITFQ